ncbi:hypothetical protein FrEUN1fDRAFT_7507 [Parafrankia sp. EUN1f]|nr:hypothetical protein FrEUN1fDRAFT_7507 [Parafrankia sp. EUN1f]
MQLTLHGGFGGRPTEKKPPEAVTSPAAYPTPWEPAGAIPAGYPTGETLEGAPDENPPSPNTPNS